MSASTTLGLRAKRWARMSALILVCALTRPSVGAHADTTLLLVREAQTLAGPPGDDAPDPRFGAPPPPMGDAPALPTVRAATEAVAQVEAWIGWGWRSGALTTVYALASSETAAAVERAGRETIAAIARAMERIDAMISDLDRDANAAEDREAASMLLARRTTLPLRGARAMIWIAAARGPDDPSVQRLLTLAAELAGTVDASRPDSAMERAVMLGQAALGAQAPEGLVAALAEFERSAAVEGASVPGATRLEVDLLRAHGAKLEKNPALAGAILDDLIARSASASGVRDFGTVMVARGTQARVVVDEGLASRSQAVRAQAVASATRILRAELGATDTSEQSPARRRASVFEACRGIASRLGPNDARPGLVIAAMAQTESGVGEDARATADRLEAWLASAEAQEDPDADEVRLAQARSLALIGDGPSAARAVSLATRFLEAHPTDDRGGDVLALACAAAVQGANAGALDTAVVVDVLRRAHAAAFEVPRRDAWRLVLLGALSGDLDTLSPGEAAARLEEMIAIAGAMAPGPDGERGAIASGESGVYLAARFEHEWDVWTTAGITPVRIAALLDAAADVLTARGLAERGARVRAEGMLVSGAFDQAWSALQGGEGVAREALTMSALARAAALRGDAESARSMLASLGATDPDAATRGAAWIADKAWRETAAHSDALPEDIANPDRARALSTALDVALETLGDGAGGASELRKRAGIAATLAQSWNDASRCLEPCLEADPGDVGVALALADARIGMGDDEGAFALLYAIATAREASRTLDRAYFRAWIRVVQVLASQRDDPARVEQAKRELARVMSLEELRAFPDLRSHGAAMAAELGVSVPE